MKRIEYGLKHPSVKLGTSDSYSGPGYSEHGSGVVSARLAALKPLTTVQRDLTFHSSPAVKQDGHLVAPPHSPTIAKHYSHSDFEDLQVAYRQMVRS